MAGFGGGTGAVTCMEPVTCRVHTDHGHCLSGVRPLSRLRQSSGPGGQLLQAWEAPQLESASTRYCLLCLVTARRRARLNTPALLLKPAEITAVHFLINLTYTRIIPQRVYRTCMCLLEQPSFPSPLDPWQCIHATGFEHRTLCRTRTSS